MIYATDFGVLESNPDNTLQLLAAIDAAKTAKDVLMLPSGTLYSDHLLVENTNGLEIRGPMFGATTLKKRNLTSGGPNITFQGCFNTHLTDLLIDGNATSSLVSGEHAGIILQGVRDFTAKRVRVQNTEGYTIYSKLGTFPSAENVDVTLEDVTLRDGSVFQLTEGVNLRWNINRCQFGDVRGSAAEGLRASLLDSKITNCFIWCKTGIAMTIKDPRNIIANNHIYAVETQNAVGIEFGEGADSIQIVGNYIKVGSGGGIPVGIIFQPGSWVYRGTTITGNTIDSRDNHIAVSGSAQVEGVKACGNVYLNNGANVSPPKVSPEILIAP